MNDVTKPTPAAAGVDEETIRLRAYELWERGGRRHDHDRDDWFAAAASLTQPETPAGASAASISKAAVDVIAEGLQGVAALATGAMTSVAELFGAHPTADAERAPSQPAHTDKAGVTDDGEAPALATEEKAVLLAQDKRIRDAKVVAEATKAAKPAGPINPDG